MSTDIKKKKNFQFVDKEFESVQQDVLDHLKSHFIRLVQAKS